MSDDHALLERWRAGDRGAGDALFERHFKGVRRFFKSKVGPDHAEDLIQRTFLGCVKGVDRYRGDASFRSYLFAIARNELYMHFRSLRTRPGSDPDVSVHSVVDLQTGVSTAIGKEDERRLIQAALRHLPVEAQTLLELAYWEGLSSEELAGVFGVSPVTIRTRKFRAREKLRELVDQLRDPHSPLVQDLDAATTHARMP